jgi:zinc protease
MNRTLLLAASLAFASAAPPARAADALDIPYQTFKLDNGLTVVVHEDHKAPIVAVDLWYHVGSKNEKTGKTGFAHLFEHLMFRPRSINGRVLPAVRARSARPTRTAPRRRTAQFLRERADHGARHGAVDGIRPHGAPAARDRPGTLDEQRGVVQNEKRAGENQPYGRMWEPCIAASFPEGHPYQLGADRSMED